MKERQILLQYFLQLSFFPLQSAFKDFFNMCNDNHYLPYPFVHHQRFYTIITAAALLLISLGVLGCVGIHVNQ